MSIQQSVALERDRMPSPKQIIAQAAKWDFAIDLDSVDLLCHSGYLPGRLDGRESGFDWRVEPASEYDDFPLPLNLGVRDIVANFTTHSDETECQLAMICSAALLALSDGIFFDDYDNVDRSPDRILEEVRRWRAEAEG